MGELYQFSPRVSQAKKTKGKVSTVNHATAGEFLNVLGHLSGAIEALGIVDLTPILKALPAALEIRAFLLDIDGFDSVVEASAFRDQSLMDLIAAYTDSELLGRVNRWSEIQVRAKPKYFAVLSKEVIKRAGLNI